MDVKELASLYEKQYGFPVSFRPSYGNAFFVPPSPHSPIPRYGSTVLKDLVRMSNKPKGGIVIGGKVGTPTVLAHEVGHGLTDDWLANIAPKVESTWRGYNLPLIGTLGAMAIGGLSEKARIPAAIANVGLQALSTVPTLYSEYLASQKGREIYPDADEEQLQDMYNSYLRAAAKRVGIPLLGHGVHHLMAT